MLEDKISQYLEVLSKAAAQAGPQVMQFAIQHEHWCGIVDVVIGLFFLIVSLFSGICLARNWKRLHANCVYGPDGEMLCLAAAQLITLVVACLQLLNIWNWVAVFNPRIALFHDILCKFLEH